MAKTDDSPLAGMLDAIKAKQANTFAGIAPDEVMPNPPIDTKVDTSDVQVHRDPVPSLGRIVHYLAANQGTRTIYAAIVCDVINDHTVCLAAFNRHGHVMSIERSTFGDKVGQWSWPPRV